MTENAGDDPGVVAVDKTVEGSVVQTIDITQYAPSWYGSGIGCERIEGVDCPWGFYWTDDFALIYDLTSCYEDSRGSIRQYVDWTKTIRGLASLPGFLGDLFTWIFGDDVPDLSFVEMEESGGFLGFGSIADKITINLGKIQTTGIALSPDNGQGNTRDIDHFEGIQIVNEIISMR